jgi:hypothetical protein
MCSKEAGTTIQSGESGVGVDHEDQETDPYGSPDDDEDPRTQREAGGGFWRQSRFEERDEPLVPASLARNLFDLDRRSHGIRPWPSVDHEPGDEAGHDRRNQSDEEGQQRPFLLFNSASGINDVVISALMVRELA